MSDAKVVAVQVDPDMLRRQRNWLLEQPRSWEADGLTNLLDAMLDLAEGFDETPTQCAGLSGECPNTPGPDGYCWVHRA